MLDRTDLLMEGFAPPRKNRAPLTAPGRSENSSLDKGKAANAKPTLDHVNKVAASLLVPAALVSTAYSDRRNALFTSPESAAGLMTWPFRTIQ